MYNNSFYNGGYYNLQDIDSLPIQDVRYIDSDKIGTLIVPPNKKTLFIDRNKMIAFVKFADFNGNVYGKEFEIKEKLQTNNNQLRNEDFVSKKDFDKLVLIIKELENKLNLTVEPKEGEGEKENKN